MTRTYISTIDCQKQMSVKSGEIPLGYNTSSQRYIISKIHISQTYIHLLQQ